MGQLFAVTQRLKPEHWKPFHAFLRDRRNTIQAARKWLLERGYSIGRGAVYNYAKAVSEGTEGVQALEEAGRKECRREITRHCECLGDQDLATLAMFAAFLVNTKKRPWNRGQKLENPAAWRRFKS